MVVFKGPSHAEVLMSPARQCSSSEPLGNVGYGVQQQQRWQQSFAQPSRPGRALLSLSPPSSADTTSTICDSTISPLQNLNHPSPPNGGLLPRVKPAPLIPSSNWVSRWKGPSWWLRPQGQGRVLVPPLRRTLSQAPPAPRTGTSPRGAKSTCAAGWHRRATGNTC